MERLTAKTVKDYLKTIITGCTKWSIGAMDNNQEYAIAIYANRRQLGSISKYPQYQSYSILPITLLLRWSKNYNTAQIKANEIYELLNRNSFFYGNYQGFINCQYEGPIDLGPDENGVYKFSIEFDVTYKTTERNDKND